MRYLVENNGRLVSKDELIKAVWSDSFVTDDSLVQCLKDIRRALGDEAQQIIKTVPRRGYIFDKEVRENGALAQTTTYTEETSGVRVVIEEGEEANGHGVFETGLPASRRSAEIVTPHRKTRGAEFFSAIKQHRLVIAAALATIVVTVAATAAYVKWWHKPYTVAVLPFVYASGNPDTEFLSDGITESVIYSLSQVSNPFELLPKLRVRARGHGFRLQRQGC